MPTRARRPSQRDLPAALLGRVERLFRRSSMLTEMERAVISRPRRSVRCTTGPPIESTRPVAMTNPRTISSASRPR